MTTSNIPPDDYAYDEVIYDHDLRRSIPDDHYVDYYPNEYDVNARTSKRGTYNIVAKDYGDHKVNYYIPRGSGNDYNIPSLEDMSIIEDPQIRHPSVVQRRIYPQYDGYDPNHGFEYIEEVPYVTPHTIVNVAPARQRDTQIITEIYEPQPPPTETIEYVYETEPRPDILEEPEYIIEEHVQQPQPIVRLNK